MKTWAAMMAIGVVFVAIPARAQEAPRFAIESGVVMGIVAVPYASVGLVRAPWTMRVSGGVGVSDCHGAQVNVGRIVSERDNAKHTFGLMWAGFRDNCPYRGRITRRTGGQYAGLAYDFQAKGFFLELGTAVGAKNPYLKSIDIAPPLQRVYGQVGYVHRFGKTYGE